MKKVRSLLFTLLAAVCVVCVAVAFSACGSKEKSGSYGAGEEGFYYYDGANSERYMLSLQSGRYMMTANGETAYSGSYSYNEGSGEISFTSGDEKFTATVGENALSLDMTGSGYSFKAYKYFNVTYVDESGETIATKSVLNGQSAEELNIEKDGYWFIGWYEDSTNSSEFAFNTSIAGDTFVYGWYIEKNPQATDYEVILDYGDGHTENAVTYNGAVWTLPSDHNGSGILGWWVSATNKSGELTYKYSIGDVFSSDTTLFAVYGGIGASVTSEGITWESAGANISVTVYNEDGSVAIAQSSTSSTNSSFAPSGFASLSTGTYTVEVTSGSVTEYLTYVVNGLERVSLSLADIVVNGEGRVLSFAPVENAAGYEITVSDGERVITEDLGSRTYYNFSSWDMTRDGITFVVTAYAEGYVSSVSSKYTYLLALDKVSVDVERDDIVWNRVENALEYYVTIVNEFGDTWEYVTAESSLSMKYLDAGTYEITVKPMTNGYYSEESTYHGYAKSAVAAPVITSISDYSVTWNEVRDAVSYVAMVNGVEYEVMEGTTLVFDDSGVPGGAGSYEIVVKAIGVYGNDSSFSDTIVATKNNFKSGISYYKNAVTWNYDIAAAYYMISVNDGENTYTSDGMNSQEIELTKEGDNNIKVTAYDKDGQGIGYAEITVYAYSVTLDGNGLNTEKDVVYVAQGDTLKLGSVSGDILEHADFLGWYTQADYTEGMSDSYEGKGYEVLDGSTFTGSRSTYLYAYYSYEYVNVRLVSTMGYMKDENGDKVEEMTVRVKYNSTSFELPEATPYNGEDNFDGWNTRSSGTGTKYTNKDGKSKATPFAGETTLYACFLSVFTYTRTTYGGETVYAVTPGSQFAQASEVTIPESYNGCYIVLNANAFQDRVTLEKINIPDTVMYIAVANDGFRSGCGAFVGCSGLEEVNIYGTESDSIKEPMYFSCDGVLFHRVNDGSSDVEILYYPYARTISADSENGISEGEYVIPSTVSNAYELDWQGGSVTHAVTTIPARVFRGREISKIVIPTSITLIASYAFYETSALTEVEFETGGTEALEIGDYAFYSCSSLKKITLPARYNEFNTGMFSGCQSLDTIEIEEADDANYFAENSVVYNADGTEIVYYPLGKGGEVNIATLASTKNASVLVIGEGAFINNKNITSIKISSTVKTVEEGAFENCQNVTSLTFDSQTAGGGTLTIKSRAFYGCTLLTELELPSSLVALEENAFGACYNLTYVKYDAYVGATVESLAGIEEGAFGTSYIQTLELGKNVPAIDFVAIFGGNYLDQVIIESGSQSFSSDNYGVVYNIDVTKILYYPVGRVGDYVVPDTITKVETSVFQNKTGLTGITINACVTEIEIDGDGNIAFYGCSNLAKITVDNTNPYYCSDDYGILYKILYSEEGEDEDPTVEEVTKFSESVEKIGLELLYCPLGIEETDLEIGGDDWNVIKVARRAFYQNKSVTSVKFEAEETFEFVEDTNSKAETFYQAYSLTNVTLPDCMTKVPGYAFANCSSLLAVNIPNSCVEIGQQAFYYCSVLGRDTELDTSKNNSNFSFPTGLETIGANAFYYDYYLAPEKIPYTVKSIGNTAFSSIRNHAELAGKIIFEETPDDYEGDPITLTIGSNAFMYTSYVTGVVISSSITSLPTAFMNIGSSLDNLEGDAEFTIEFTGETKLTSLSAFSSIKYLKSINIPASVQSVSLTGMTGLESITFGKEETEEAQEEGTSQEISLTSLNLSNASSLETINLPESVTSINLSGCEKLESITIPSGVTSIGSAFSNCTSLKEVEFGENINLTSMGSSAFSGCTSLKEMTIPASVTGSIDSSAFANCTSLEKVEFENGAAPTAINSSAFSGCEKLESLQLPDTITTIGASAFAGCVSLASVDIPDGVTSIGGSAFSGCEKLVDVEIPAGVATISASTFEGCTALEKVTFGDVSALGSVSDSAFANCVSLNEFAFPESTAESITLGKNIFEGCSLGEVTLSSNIIDLGSAFMGAKIAKITVTNGNTSYKTDSDGTILYEIMDEKTVVFVAGEIATNNGTVEIASGVETIGVGAFEGHDEIRRLVIPSGVKEICSYAFANCGGLEAVEIENDAGGELIIGSYAFYKCENLRNVNIPASVEEIGTNAFAYCSSLQNVNIANDTSITGEEIGTYAFYYCSSLESIDLPASIVYLPDYCFAESGLSGKLVLQYVESTGTYTFQHTKIESVEMPSMLSLGNYSFSEVETLKEVTFGNNFETLGTYSFSGCTSLESVENLGLVTQISNYSFQSTAIKSMVLPKTCTKIGTQGFYDCEQLVEIDLPDTLTSIGQKAFMYCYALESIDLPQSLTSMSSDAFAYTTSLKSVVLPGSLGTSLSASQRIFQYSGVESVEMEDGLGYLASYSFQYCENLTSVIVGKDVRSSRSSGSSDSWFAGCTSLTYAYTGDSQDSVVASMFNGCTALETVELGPNVTKIGNNAFYGCTSLKELSLPTGLETMGSNVFYGCESLESVFVPRTVTSVGMSAFDSCKVVYIDNIYDFCANNWTSGWDSNVGEIYFRSDLEPETFNKTCTDYDRGYWHYDDNDKVTIWVFDYPIFTAEDGSYVVCGKDDAQGILYVCFYEKTSGDVGVGAGEPETIVTITVFKVVNSVTDSDGSYSVTLESGDVYKITLETMNGTNTATIVKES